MPEQQAGRNVDIAKIELTEDEIDTLVYESGPDADYDHIVIAVESIIAARIESASAVLREGLEDEALEATGVMERALDALRASPAAD